MRVLSFTIDCTPDSLKASGAHVLCLRWSTAISIIHPIFYSSLEFTFLRVMAINNPLISPTWCILRNTEKIVFIFFFDALFKMAPVLNMVIEADTTVFCSKTIFFHAFIDTLGLVVEFLDCIRNILANRLIAIIRVGVLILPFVANISPWKDQATVTIGIALVGAAILVKLTGFSTLWCIVSWDYSQECHNGKFGQSHISWFNLSFIIQK